MNVGTVREPHVTVVTVSTKDLDSAGGQANGPLSSLDQGIVLCEQHREMTVHFEIALAESIDGSRFRRAVQAVVEQSERLRARVVIRRWTSNTVRWGERPAAECVDVAEVDCTRAELAEVRDAFVSRGFDVTTDPLVRFLIAHHGSEGSSLIVLSHHVVSDGTGMWAVILQVSEQYGREGIGEVDGGTSEDSSPGRDVSPMESVTGSDEAPDAERPAVGPVRAILDAVRAILDAPRPERLSPRGGARADDTLVELRILEGSVVEALLRSPLMASVQGATLNDLLLLALHQALADWNSRCGRVPDQISVTVPINQRRRGDTTLRNSAGQGSTVTSGADRSDPYEGLRSVVEQTRAIKQDRGRADPSSSAGSLWFMPTGIRALIPRLVGFVSRERFLNTSRLSNMGRIEFPDTGLRFTDVWFSVPVRMPQGATVGVVQSGPNITVAVRCCRRLWDRSAAQEFADLVIDHAVELSGK